MPHEIYLGDSFWSRSRLLSIVVVLVYASVGFGSGGLVRAFEVVLSCTLPLACIWFPEELGSYTGYAGSGRFITQTSPAAFVAFMGWVVLLLPAVIGIGFVLMRL